MSRQYSLKENASESNLDLLASTGGWLASSDDMTGVEDVDDALLSSM